MLVYEFRTTYTATAFDNLESIFEELERYVNAPTHSFAVKRNTHHIHIADPLDYYRTFMNLAQREQISQDRGSRLNLIFWKNLHADTKSAFEEISRHRYNVPDPPHGCTFLELGQLANEVSQKWEHKRVAPELTKMPFNESEARRLFGGEFERSSAPERGGYRRSGQQAYARSASMPSSPRGKGSGSNPSATTRCSG